MSSSKSLRGTCSFLVNSDVSQNSAAPPVTRNVTISMPVKPWVMASLPRGAIRPQNAHAKNRQMWAMSGWFLLLYNMVVCFLCKGNAKFRLGEVKGI